MKIAILGNGGREHAIATSITKSKQVKEIYCIPGNAGTSQIATNISINLNEFEVFKQLKKCKIKTIYVGHNSQPNSSLNLIHLLNRILRVKNIQFILKM